jgi:hypothetical protein
MHWYQVLLAIVWLSFPFITHYYYRRWVRKRSEAVEKELPDESLLLIRNVRLWFSGYDTTTLQHSLKQINPTTLHYNFYRADLYFDNPDLIVAGKQKMYQFSGPDIFLKPLIIPIGLQKGERKNNIIHVSNEVVGNDYRVEFIDVSYPNKLILIIPKMGSEIWAAIKSRSAHFKDFRENNISHEQENQAATSK